ncbi:similar to Saccharomyces cerevisiae YML114C TAF8 TFIID subunit (65 kDa), involved in RNA polymerase II transcription initiation [Maudiozyma saulgeensis]|uniref:Transcription initiation factor TFIID subunit 8 n=1 Tax=Maudiozyma saulgeensis TaxID=1789683 RepID=A0A1X7R4T0_9SACH|nr:similar to Saccharomyces cerevisiae YML114C TAF8 TFIID subunit (65 kDa), involved in RNA polymerase II transcription initiation [Kazachstania saulgeensis]
MTQDYAPETQRKGNNVATMISDLPNPEEIRHEAMEPELESLWLKALALQLKPMNCNTEISRSAFELLSVLAMEQMDSMASELHRITTIQRRQRAAKMDVSLLLRGFNLAPDDLDITLQQTQHLKKQYIPQSSTINSETQELNKIKDQIKKDKLLNNTPFQLIEQEQEAALPLRSSNNLQKYIPHWLPKFPPDHTYMFTPQYNNPTTNEVLIRIKAAEEGRQSEKSLLGFLGARYDNEPSLDIPSEKNIIDNENVLPKVEATIYPYSNKRTGEEYRTGSNRVTKRLPLSTLTHIPKTFNVEEYAHKRIELARAKVNEYELKQLHRNNDPFLNLTKLVIQNDKTIKNRFQVDKEVKDTLRNSFRMMLSRIPETRKEKARVIQEAKKRRELKLEELKLLQEKRDKERKSDTATSAHLETILFETNFTANRNSNGVGVGSNNGDDMGLFDTLDSSDDEAHPIDIKITTDDGDDKNPEDGDINTIDGTSLPKETTTPSFNIVPRSIQDVATEEHHVTIMEPSKVEERNVTTYTVANTDLPDGTTTVTSAAISTDITMVTSDIAATTEAVSSDSGTDTVADTTKATRVSIGVPEADEGEQSISENQPVQERTESKESDDI